MSSEKKSLLLPAWGGGQYHLDSGHGPGLTAGYDYLLGTVPFPSVGLRFGGNQGGFGISGPIPGISLDNGMPAGWSWNHPQSVWAWLRDKMHNDEVEQPDETPANKPVIAPKKDNKAVKAGSEPAMDSNQLFKAALFGEMAKFGFTPEQTDGAASLVLLIQDATQDKQAIDLGTLAMLGLVGVPVAVGLTGGYMAARAGDDPLAVERLKHKELINELNFQTDALRRQATARNKAKMPTMAIPAPMGTHA